MFTLNSLSQHLLRFIFNYVAAFFPGIIECLLHLFVLMYICFINLFYEAVLIICYVADYFSGIKRTLIHILLLFFTDLLHILLS